MRQSLLIWGLFLIIGFPLLTIILGEFKSYLKRKANPLEVFVNNLQTLVLPPLVILLILEQLLELEELGIFLQILKTILWVAVVYTALALLKALLVTEESEKRYLWQIVVPNLFFQVTRAMIVLGIGAYVVGEVWKFDLNQIVAALGVGSIVVALALQDTFSNLVSGFLLLLESPFKKGDFLRINNTEGQVIEMNWRAVRLRTFLDNVVVIPNGVLGKQEILNYNLPSPNRWLSLDIGFSYNDPPYKVEKAIEQAWQETPGVTGDLGFSFTIQSYGDFSINYTIWYEAPDYYSGFAIRRFFRKRIYYVAKRNGLTIPFPIRHVYHANLDKENLEHRSQKLAEYLRSLPYFATVESEAIERLALDAEIEYYGLDEQILQQGQLVPGLYIIQRGSAVLTFQDPQGNKQTIAKVFPGDFFGEAVLMSGKPSAVSVNATEDLLVIRLEPEAIANLLAERPLFAKQIDELIDGRRKTIRRLKGEEKPTPDNTVGNSNLNSGSLLDQFRS